MAKNYARTFGQDLMRGEHVVGGGMSDRPGGLGGTLMKSLSSHPLYYEQKSRAEAKLGRTLGNEEFERDHWREPDSEIISGTSLFDPTLCELAYRWFCPPDGLVLDPFAGGSVRGIVASKLGRPYVGVDLRPEQVAANREQGDAICSDPVPVWHVGDSRDIARICDGVAADFVFSCPPYGDLEVYSDDPGDLSTLGYDEFMDAYRGIIAATCSLLKPDRFACFVVGDFRDKAGFYRGFPWHTIDAFQAAGLRLYNEAILVTAVGSLPIRVGKQFQATRKLGKTHQQCLVFVKGAPKRATAAVGPVDFAEPGPDPEVSDADSAFGELL